MYEEEIYFLFSAIVQNKIPPAQDQEKRKMFLHNARGFINYS